MHVMRSGRRALGAGIIVLTLGLALYAPLSAFAATLMPVSSDPFTNPISQHATQVEPDTYAYGSMIVAAFQSGRFFDGGSSDIGWSTSTDNGTTWTHGFLPGITTFVGGPYDRVSDPSVAYDAKHGVWLISSLSIFGAGAANGVIVSRSTDGGKTWGNPVTVTPPRGLDKDWIVCDDTASSPFYGRCYVEWDDNGNGNLIEMSTSNDGGLTWGPVRFTANFATGIGGQPVVEPNGVVVVPIDDPSGATYVQLFYSANGGASWSQTYPIAGIVSATDPVGLRSGPLPSVEIDGSGKIYIVWEDCRFEPGCATHTGANDIVMETIGGPGSFVVRRIPIDPIGSGVDHFIPGIAVDRTTSGSSAHITLTYYYYPNVNCTVATCQLDVGFVSSTDGGATWSAPIQLAGPMNVTWLPNTTLGYMVGDYISTSFVSSGKAVPVFAVAGAPSGGVFNEAMYAPAGGLTLAAGTVPMSSNEPVLSMASSRARPVPPITRH